MKKYIIILLLLANTFVSSAQKETYLGGFAYLLEYTVQPIIPDNDFLERFYQEYYLHEDYERSKEDDSILIPVPHTPKDKYLSLYFEPISDTIYKIISYGGEIHHVGSFYVKYCFKDKRGYEYVLKGDVPDKVISRKLQPKEISHKSYAIAYDPTCKEFTYDTSTGEIKFLQFSFF